MGVQGLIVFEDEHLLVIRKPSGINTHAAGPYAGEGIYDWLRRREPRWADLAIVQRLDKETSGLLLFSKSRQANASLTKQFSRRRVAKEYVLLTDRQPRANDLEARSRIRKGRGRFESHTDPSADGLEAETAFHVLPSNEPTWTLLAEPRTGRTHQIRLHAADLGSPILGDTLYGGTPYPRLCLHARRLQLRHPVTNEPLDFIDEPDFADPVRIGLRQALIDPRETTALRWVHGAADGRPGWYVDRLGDYLIASVLVAPEGPPPNWLQDLASTGACHGLYVRLLDRHIRQAANTDPSPRLWTGEAAPGEFPVKENGLTFQLSLAEGYSTGLFLDQRDNRRRLIRNWIGPGFPVHPDGLVGKSVLNVFAYTCAFSVAAAAAGAATTSLDLSRKYLDWGRRNFLANDLDLSPHDFIYGDALDWLRRLARKGRSFDVVILDPPTFSQSREHGVFRVEADLNNLVAAGASLLNPGGVLLASTNSARLPPEGFLDLVQAGIRAAGRRADQQLFIPQPPDFPTCHEEPGYLKTVWMRVNLG